VGKFTKFKQLYCPYPSSEDLTGTTIVSTNQKPFVVFSGGGAMFISCLAAGQHLYEQNYPIDSWGKEYLIAPYKNASKGFLYRVVASEDNTQVQIKIGNNIPTNVTLQKGSFYEGNVNTLLNFAGEIYVSADKPINVSQYMKGAGCNGISTMNNRGDPNMLILNALNQPVQRTVFNTVSTPTDVMDAHFVNIITKTNNIDKIKLQGTFLSPALFQPMTARAGYSYAQVDLVPYGIDPVLGKSFTLETDSTFIAYVYGYGNASSYAYSVGANFVKLDYKFTASKEKICVGETIDFVGEGTNILSYTWDFGDGSPTQMGQQISHTYTQAGTYTAKMTVQILGSFVSHSTTKTIEVYPLVVPDLGADQTHCVGKGFVLDSKINIAGITYTWWRDGAVLPTAQSGTLQTDIAGTYIIEAKTDKGCSRKDTVVLAYYPTIQAQIINLLSEYFTDNAPVVLEGLPAGGVFTLNGSTTNELSPATMRVGKHKVVYTYQDVHGCIWKDSTMVQITNPAVRFFMPNSFTPNGDGLNDLLQIFGDNFLYLDVRIYNRWGEVVFATDNKEKMWNGTVNGKPAPAGVYMCIAEYTEPREKKRIKYQSFIQLIR
jgi:gliding motility-associated-like protein